MPRTAKKSETPVNISFQLLILLRSLIPRQSHSTPSPEKGAMVNGGSWRCGEAVGRIAICVKAVTLFFSDRFGQGIKFLSARQLLQPTMPPSQLKQLKSSLRDSGVIGPQQSKKQKRQNAKTGVSAQNRNQRNTALQAIRDRFNPFEIKVPSNRSKFEATTRDGSSASAPRARPGVTKSLGEERVCLTFITRTVTSS